MNYKDMNIYDLASILHNIMADEEMSLRVVINGHAFMPYDMVVDDGEICLIGNDKRLMVKELTDQEMREEIQKEQEELDNA
jgi:hypothetical protein